GLACAENISPGLRQHDVQRRPAGRDQPGDQGVPVHGGQAYHDNLVVPVALPAQVDEPQDNRQADNERQRHNDLLPGDRLATVPPVSPPLQHPHGSVHLSAASLRQPTVYGIHLSFSDSRPRYSTLSLSSGGSNATTLPPATASSSTTSPVSGSSQLARNSPPASRRSRSNGSGCRAYTV